MNSKPLLKDIKKIKVCIDSNTLENSLNKKDRLATAILRYHNSDILEFVRSPFETKYKELKNIIEYRLVGDSDKIRKIEIVRELKEPYVGNSESTFHYNLQYVKIMTNGIFRKTEEEYLNKMESILVQVIFSDSFDKSEKSIYITDDDTILKKRLLLEFKFQHLNIMTIDEASIFLDLFFKKNEKYYADSRFKLDKGYWYFLSARLKIPHYNTRDVLVDAMFYKFYYALMALDEIGIQYYLGVNNDTMDNTLYHFNYLISLITGIFDNLALKTDGCLNINFQYKIRISLHNSNGEDFLKEIKSKNINIWNHIKDYAAFIRLIYLFRENIIHREGLPKTSFEYRDDDIRWEANFIKISNDIRNEIKQCGDSNSKYDPFSKWGTYKIRDMTFLDSYHFSIQALNMLSKFIDIYLELLNYSSFIEKQKQKNDEFTRTLNIFDNNHLGL